MRQGWLIRSSPEATARAATREIHLARSIVLEVWPGECLARLERSDRSANAKARLRRYIDQWWARYERDYQAQTWTWLGIPHESILTHFRLEDRAS